MMDIKEILENGKYVIEYEESESELFNDYHAKFKVVEGYIEYLDKKYKFMLHVESYFDGTDFENYKELYINDKSIKDIDLIDTAYNKIHKTLIKQILNQ